MTHTHINPFEKIKQSSDESELWRARELMPLLGYKTRRQFEEAISRAKESCKTAGNSIEKEFLPAPAKTSSEKGGRPQKDFLLTRYACYLVAQNGDTRKPEIGYAQTYFAIQTRRQELADDAKEYLDWYASRRGFSESHKDLSSHLMGDKEFSKDELTKTVERGTAEFYGESDKQRKKRYGIKGNLLDYEHPLLLDGRKLANRATIYKTQNIHHKSQITQAHIQSNKKIRQSLEEMGISVLHVKPLLDIKEKRESVKKIGRKIGKEEKIIKNEVHEKYQSEKTLMSDAKNEYIMRPNSLPELTDSIARMANIIKEHSGENVLYVNDKVVVKINSEGLKKLQKELNVVVDLNDGPPILI